MSSDYWLKQQSNEPLFPDILWSRPQHKAGAGKLAVIGGDSHGFSAPGMAYGAALSSGAGVCKVLLPDAIKKLVKGILPDAGYAPSTPSGSFAKRALSDLLEQAQWSDLCLLAGDLGRNSETAMMLEEFTSHYTGSLTLAQDAVDYFKEIPLQIVNRPKTLIVLSLSQLQKLFIATPTITPIMLSMTTQQLVEALHEYTATREACVMTKHNDMIFVAHKGHIATHKNDQKIWRVETAARASVFWMQNPETIFDATVTSLLAEQTKAA